MRIIPYIAGAAAVSAVHANAAANDTEKTGSMFWPGSSHLDLAMPWHKNHRDLEARADSGMASLSTRWNKCLDVPSGNFKSGTVPQLWDCSNNVNQQWKINGKLLQASNNVCLDVPSGWAFAGAPVQLWACDQNNQNQWFEVAGNGIRKRNSNFCLDVKDGHYDNGAGLQLWWCDYNANGNQNFKMGNAATFTTQQSPSSFLGYASVSWERFAQLHPECAPWGNAMKAAASAMNLAPTLLGAIAMNEATCQERPGNGFGMFQFMDQNAWVRYGGANADKQKASDAIWGGARYMRALIDQEGNNLDNALRAYNGPIWQGGDPAYQAHIRTWMSGGSVW